MYICITAEKSYYMLLLCPTSLNKQYFHVIVNEWRIYVLKTGSLSVKVPTNFLSVTMFIFELTA